MGRGVGAYIKIFGRPLDPKDLKNYNRSYVVEMDLVTKSDLKRI